MQKLSAVVVPLPGHFILNLKMELREGSDNFTWREPSLRLLIFDPPV